MVVMNELYDIDLHFDFLPFSLRSVGTAGELLESHFLDQASPSYSSGGQFFQANEFFDCPNAQAKHCGCLTFGKQELFTHCGYPLRKFPLTRAVCWQREQHCNASELARINSCEEISGNSLASASTNRGTAAHFGGCGRRSFCRTYVSESS